MNLPNLNDVELPKRIMAGVMAMYFIKDITDMWLALMAYGFIAYVITCQTVTDVYGKKTNPPA